MDNNYYRRKDSLSFERLAEKRVRSRYLQFNHKNPLLWIFGLLIVFASLVFILGFNLKPNVATISRADLGTIALLDYKAPRDFEYDRTDWEATERIRKERENEVLPIFRWDTQIHEESVLRCNDAFDMMRKRLAKQRENEIFNRLPRILKISGEENQDDELRIKVVESIFGKFENSSLLDSQLTAVLKQDAKSIATSMREWALESKSAFTDSLGVAMSDNLYMWLYEQGFSAELQAQFVVVLDLILGRKIIASQRVIGENNAIELQWNELTQKKSKTFQGEELYTFSDMDSSLTAMRNAVESSFKTAPPDILELFVQFLKPNVVFDAQATQKVRSEISEQTPELRVRQVFKKGQTIVSNGDPITEEHVEIYSQIELESKDFRGDLSRWLALAVIVGILMFLLWRPLRGTYWGTQRSHRDLLYFAFNLIAFALSLRLLSMIFTTIETAWNLPFKLMLMFPFAAGPMLIRLVVNRLFSFLFAIAVIVISFLVSADSIFMVSYFVVTSLAGSLLLERPKSRSIILRRGFMIGILGASIAVATLLLSPLNYNVWQFVIIGVLAVTGGFIAAATVTIGLPIAESLFGYATTTKLLELSNLDHPALKNLFMEAPGTYQHSMMVGSLNEAAAEAIGANAVLARVGGYYHDIGKVKNAQYFAENQRGDNPHNRLKPNMSALILKTHVKDGIELAKKHGLPQDIIDFIATHHGTSRIEFFYQRAKQQEESVREEDFRYPGPRPQSRETGICMVSDMVEAAVRSLPDKNPDKIKFLVHRLINHKFADGQFDECDLTLRDLNNIANAVLGILNAVYHTRPEYPDQKREREKQEAKKKLEAEKTENSEANTDDKGAKSETDSKPEGSEAKKSQKSETVRKMGEFSKEAVKDNLKRESSRKTGEFSKESVKEGTKKDATRTTAEFSKESVKQASNASNEAPVSVKEQKSTHAQEQIAEEEGEEKAALEVKSEDLQVELNTQVDDNNAQVAEEEDEGAEVEQEDVPADYQFADKINVFKKQSP